MPNTNNSNKAFSISALKNRVVGLDEVFNVIDRVSKIEEGWTPKDVIAIEKAKEKVNKVVIAKLIGENKDQLLKGWFGFSTWINPEMELKQVRAMLKCCGKVSVSQVLSLEQIKKAIEYYSKYIPETVLEEERSFNRWRAEHHKSDPVSDFFKGNPLKLKEQIDPKLHCLMDEIQLELVKIKKIIKEKEKKQRVNPNQK